MKQGFGYCFPFRKDEIVFYDSIRIHVVRFDLKRVGRYDCIDEARKGILELFPGLPMNEDGETDDIKSDGPVVVMGYWSRTITWNGLEPTMRKQLAVMARAEYKLFTENPAMLDSRRRLLLHVLKTVWSNPDEIEENLRVENQDAAERLGSNAAANEGSGPSSEAREVDSLVMDIVQDEGRINKVVRMTMEDCTKLFPRARGDYKTVIVKVLDFSNIGMFHQTRDSSWYHDMSLEQFEKCCVDGFVDEVECYHRIALYNRMHPDEPPIHVPDMLDYGTCCIRDSQMNSIEGFYLVLEDLKDVSRPPKAHSALSYDLERLKSIGITHMDLTARNQFKKGSQIYLFDFNMVDISRGVHHG